MHDTAAVRVLERLADLDEVAQQASESIFLVHRFVARVDLAQDVGQRRLIDEPHDEVRTEVDVVSGIVDGDDVGVLQTARQMRFPR